MRPFLSTPHSHPNQAMRTVPDAPPSASVRSMALPALFPALLLLLLSACGVPLSGGDNLSPTQDSEARIRQAITNIDLFATNAAVTLLVILTALYVVQLSIAVFRTFERTTTRRSDGSDVSVKILDHLTNYHYGLRDAWVFLILALLLPVFLNSMSNLIPLVNYKEKVPALEQLLSNLPNQTPQTVETGDPRPNDLDRLDSILGALEANTSESQSLISSLQRSIDSDAESQRLLSILSTLDSDEELLVQLLRESIATLQLRLRDPERPSTGGLEFSELLADVATPQSKWVYHVCLTFIGVLITLEFSYVHTLRRSAPDWIPMLLSALVLDLITLLVLIFVVGNPDDWKGTPPATATQTAYAVATIAAFISSVVILVLARTAGALHDDLTLVSPNAPDEQPAGD